jgi:hypothetical protein
VQLDPTGASRYYFNEGITLYNNAGMKQPGRRLLQPSIRCWPQIQQSRCLLPKGCNFVRYVDSENRRTLEPPAGTSESLQKYLDLQPSGNYADQAKGMLSMLGQKGRNILRNVKSQKEVSPAIGTVLGQLRLPFSF